MTLKAKIVIAALALVLAVAGWFAMQDRGSDPAANPDGAAMPGNDERPETERRRRRAATKPVETETPDEVETTATADEPPEEPQEFVVRTNVPGAHVSVEFQYYGGTPDPARSEKVTGADGSAQFLRAPHPMELAEIVVLCEATGYGRVRKTTTSNEIELTLQPALLLSGVVRSDRGESLDGAQLRAGNGGWAETDGEGRFSMFMTGDSEVMLAVQHSSHRTKQARAVAGAGPIVIVLERGEQVSGRVTWPSGDPAAGVALTAQHAWAETDADGRYVLSGLTVGPIDVDCKGVAENRVVQAGAAAVDFTLERHAVRMRLVDEEGRPFRHAVMALRATRDGSTVMTSAGMADSIVGRLVFLDTGATLKVSPAAPGHLDEVTTLVIEGEPAQHDLEIVLRRGTATGVIALLARDSAGVPLKTVFIDLHDDSGSPVSTWYEKEVSLDAEGRAQLSNVPLGKVTVAVSTTKSAWSTHGLGLRYEQTVTVVADGEASVSAVVRDGGRVRVTARDMRGEVIAPKRLHLLDEDGEYISGLFLTVRGPGAYTTALDDAVPVLFGSPLPPGRYRVVSMPGTSQETVRDVSVVAGRIEEVDIEVPDAPE
jgi:hypothetical protein